MYQFEHDSLGEQVLMKVHSWQRLRSGKKRHVFEVELLQLLEDHDQDCPKRMETEAPRRELILKAFS